METLGYRLKLPKILRPQKWPKMAKKWKPWVSGSKCWHELVVNEFCYMSQFWAKMSYLGGRLVPLVEVTD